MNSDIWFPCLETKRNGYKMCVPLLEEQFFEAAVVKKSNFSKFLTTSVRLF